MATSKLGPAGSLQPLDANKGNWTDGLGGQQLAELRGLAEEINKTVDTTVKQVARGKIRVGKLLLEARAHFVDNDAGFGLWRRENTSVQSKQHAHYLMQVAERFGDAPKLIDGVNYSVMQELVLADQADIQWVEQKIDEGDLPTVVEVRKKVKQTQAERLAGAQQLTGTSKKGTVITPGIIKSPNASVNSLVSMSLSLRIKQVLERQIKDITGDFIILGMDPDPQCPCHPDLMEIIQDHWLSVAENNDEKRAVIDSTQRAIKEFKSWGSS